MNLTRSKILEILEMEPNLASYQIMEKLNKEGYDVTNDTLDKNLKTMTKEGRLKRTAQGSPWRYYYNVNREELVSQR